MRNGSVDGSRSRKLKAIDPEDLFGPFGRGALDELKRVTGSSKMTGNRGGPRPSTWRQTAKYKVLHFPPMVQPVLEDALRLPVAERIELVQAIWDSVVAESSAVPVTDEQRIELDRRLADAEANPADERPWSEVRASLERSR